MEYVYIALVIALGAYVIAVRPKWALAGAVGFAVAAAGGYLGFVEYLGLPKPIKAEWRDMTKIEVIAFVAAPGEAVYLWVRREKPVAYVMEWNVEVAAALAGAFEEGEPGEAVMLERNGPVGDPYGGWAAHPMPHNELPSKE